MKKWKWINLTELKKDLENFAKYMIENCENIRLWKELFWRKKKIVKENFSKPIFCKGLRKKSNIKWSLKKNLKNSIHKKYKLSEILSKSWKKREQNSVEIIISRKKHTSFFHISYIYWENLWIFFFFGYTLRKRSEFY